MAFDEWKAIGHQLGEFTGAAIWMIGDWFAYGLENYMDSKWNGRVPDGLYAQLARSTGYSEGALRNAKCVCAALPLSRRRDKLTLAHAAEIVGRADPKDYDAWIERTVTEGLSQKALRELLRKANSSHLEEPNDTGVLSILETTRQYVRDYQASASKLTPTLRAELKKILTPVLRDIAG